MPSIDASLKFALIRAGVPAANADELVTKIPSMNVINTFLGTTNFQGAVTINPAAPVSITPGNANVTISPSGTGVVSVNPAGAGSAINNVSLGQVTPAPVKTSNLAATFADSSGTPGNVTNSNPRGSAAFAAGSSTVTVTSTLVTAASGVFIQVGGSDATLISARVNVAAGSFTVTGNAAATAVTPFDFLVVN